MLVNSPVDSTTLGLGSETVKTLVNYPQTREWQIYFVEPATCKVLAFLRYQCRRLRELNRTEGKLMPFVESNLKYLSSALICVQRINFSKNMFYTYDYRHLRKPRRIKRSF